MMKRKVFFKIAEAYEDKQSIILRECFYTVEEKYIFYGTAFSKLRKFRVGGGMQVG